MLAASTLRASPGRSSVAAAAGAVRRWVSVGLPRRPGGAVAAANLGSTPWRPAARRPSAGAGLPWPRAASSLGEGARPPHLDARRVILEEARALQAVAERIGEPFDRAVALIEGMPPGGRVIITGVGKSGHVARKVAASMSSTGTAAFFVHSTEALHGDLGGARQGDVCIAISYSGATAETLVASRGFRRMGCTTIAVTSVASSELGRECDVCLELGSIPELDHNRLAPTASTAAALALGDALTVVISKRRGFSRADFEMVHPGGELGRQNRLEMAALASKKMREEHLKAAREETAQ